MREIRKKMKSNVESKQGGKLFYFPPEIRKEICLSSISIYDKEKSISILFRDDTLYSYKALYLRLADDAQLKKVKAFIDGISLRFKKEITNE